MKLIFRTLNWWKKKKKIMEIYKDIIKKKRVILSVLLIVIMAFKWINGSLLVLANPVFHISDWSRYNAFFLFLSLSQCNIQYWFDVQLELLRRCIVVNCQLYYHQQLNKIKFWCTKNVKKKCTHVINRDSVIKRSVH